MLAEKYGAKTLCTLSLQRKVQIVSTFKALSGLENTAFPVAFQSREEYLPVPSAPLKVKARTGKTRAIKIELKQ
jgi:hypothetical protein